MTCVLPAPSLKPLSPREESVVRLAGMGLTDKGIACELGIAEGTVGHYWRRAFHKLRVNSRAAAVAVWFEVRIRD